jgi:hypothetical protein
MVMIRLVKSNDGLPTSMRENPPILFVSEVKKVDGDGVETNITEFIEFHLFVPINHYPGISKSLSLLRISYLKT